MFSILLIAIGLSIDSLTVSVASASACKQKSNWIFFRFALILGFIQATFIIAGWATGIELENYFKIYDHWLAFVLLSFIGGKMLYDGIKCKNEEEKPQINIKNFFVVAGLGVATSIDALVVGISLPLMNLNIWLSAIIIFLTTFAFSIVGLFSGDIIKRKFNKFPIEFIGGLFLIGIGVKVLVEHLIQGC